MKWSLLNDQEVANLDQLKSVLLENRKIGDQDLFFHPIHPIDLSLDNVGIDQQQMEQTVARLQKAIQQKEKIVVFGDYDADGVCATSILWMTLHHLGADAIPFIPNRERHGYGISKVAIDEIFFKNKPSLIITVDNGIVAFDVVDYVNELGVEIIITDHHQPEFEDEKPIFPKATQIVHSTKLCGATVAWMLAKQLDESFALNQLDLAGIATIADQVPLVDANRSFAKFGIEALKHTNRPGLLALIERSMLKKEEINSTKINFVIAPRINAMGRLEDGLDALRLLCTTNLERAQQLSALLNQTNDRRKDLTFDMVSEADSKSEAWENEHVIIVASSEYHEGVIGLIAGRLSEKYYKPAIAISVGEKRAKASARSVAGVDIVHLLRLLKDDLLAVGGHPMAAGFGVESSKLEMVTQKIRQIALTQIDPSLLEPLLEAECTLEGNLIDLDILKLLSEFEPFGQQNRLPIFKLEDFEVVDAKLMGKEQNHLRLLIKKDERIFTCLGWGKADLLNQISPGDKINLLTTLQLNEWNGKSSVQLILKDLRIC